ncbi:MAG: hypothetical protein ACLR0U_11225 [Enterocloster clostridioformis]
MTKVQAFSFSKIDKFSTAGLVTRMTTDVTNIQSSLSNVLSGGCQGAPYAVYAAWPCIFHDWPSDQHVFLGAILFLACVIWESS